MFILLLLITRLSHLKIYPDKYSRQIDRYSREKNVNASNVRQKLFKKRSAHNRNLICKWSNAVGI